MNGHTRLIYWLLGVLVAVILGISKLVISYQITQAEIINQRLIQLEVSAADRGRAQQDAERRLQRIEDKIDEIHKWVK